MGTMKIVIGMVLVASLGLPHAAAAEQKARASLYERLGGKAALTAVVDDFFGRAAADVRINKKFAKTDVPRYKFRLVQQLCNVTGGPCPPLPHDMATVHSKLSITDGEFDAVVELLAATLDKFKVAKPEQDELLGILGPLRAQIVQVHSKDTGTPLPAAFRPAPPLDPAERKKVEAYERRHARPPAEK